MNMNHLFNKTVSTYRKTDTVDSGGGVISTLTEEIGALKCRLQQATGREILKGGGKFAQIEFVLYADSTADLLMADTVLINGVFYEIVGKAIEGNEGIYQKVFLEKSKE